MIYLFNQLLQVTINKGMKILENNKLIAEFLWGKPEDEVWYRNKDIINTITFSKGSHHIDQLCFHESWDWLMPVVEKIESLDIVEDAIYAVSISNRVCKIETSQIEICWNRKKNKINAVYQSVIEFIKWFKENNTPNLK